MRPVLASGLLAVAVAWVCVLSPAQAAPGQQRAPAQAPPAAANQQPGLAGREALVSLVALPDPSLPQPQVLDALLNDAPMLREAQSLKEAAAQNGQVLRAGTQEFTGQAQVQQRRIDSAPDAGTYAEWQLLLSRPIRLPSQTQADIRMAGALSHAADATLIEARQMLLQGALTAWFQAQLTQADVVLVKDNLGLLHTQVQALHRRNALGDASVLELEQLQAEEARAESSLVLAQGLAESARSALTARYPAFGQDSQLVGQPASAAQLSLPALPVDALRTLVEQHSARLAQDRARLQEAQAAAEQAHAARTPQPTVGAYLGSDRGGREHIVGLQFSMPFGGAARVARERSALAGVDAAQWRLQDARAQTLAAFARLYALARSQASGSLALERASQVQNQASARMLRAYQLGEAGISDWLIARRSALDTVRQALQARFNAAESAASLRLQAGLLLNRADVASETSPAAAVPASEPESQK
ncbi:MAG: TolC family protein [Proteobacteria bacterium]|nr:TolC family protein [Pseudomonadota bacterium]